MEDYYLDGTKIEANANKYDANLDEKYQQIVAMIEQVIIEFLLE